MSRTIAVTSGKGGVGKTSISVNLALTLARKGFRVCLFDADLGLANINILLGLQPEATLADVLKSGRKFSDIMLVYEGIHVLPGSSGVEELADLSPADTERIVQSFEFLQDHDFILFDTSAGVSRDVVAFCLASSEVLLVMTPEPTSLTDAYALLKILLLNGFQGQVKVIINQCKTIDVAQVVYKKFKMAVSKHLDMEVTALGVIFEDNHVTEAVKQQKALLTIYPESKAGKCIEKLGERLLADKTGELENPDMGSFWERCLDLFRSPLNLRGITAAAQKNGPHAPSAGTRQEASPLPREKEPDKTESSRPSEEPENQQLAAGIEGREPASLITSIASVSTELRRLRHAIEKRNGNGTGQEPADKYSRPDPIRLDLDAFLARKLRKVKGKKHGQ